MSVSKDVHCVQGHHFLAVERKPVYGIVHKQVDAQGTDHMHTNSDMVYFKHAHKD